MSKLVIHGGKIGDLIYSMAALRGLYFMTGTRFRVVLIPNPSWSFTINEMDYVRPLLECQAYIESVEYSTDNDHYDLDLRDVFKVPFFKRINIAKLYCNTLDVEDKYYKEPWLSVPAKRTCKDKRVLVCRTNRHPSAKPSAVWKQILKEHTPSDFLGHSAECGAFNEFAGTALPCLELENALQTAQNILQSKRLLCNQTSALAIATGLGVPVTVEVAKGYPDCLFERPGADYRGVSKSVMNECKVVWECSS
jgi:hypothetical protein